MAKVSKGVIGKQALALPLLLLTTAAWFVTLVGLAISAHDGGESGLGFIWFVWALEGFVLFFCILHLIEVGAGYSLAHAAVASLLAVVTVLTILETEALNTTRKLNQGTSRLHKGIIVAFAGFLILSVLNGLLLIVLGTQHDAGRSSHKKDEGLSSRPVAGAQPYGTVPAGGQGYVPQSNQGLSTVV